MIANASAFVSLVAIAVLLASSSASAENAPVASYEADDERGAAGLRADLERIVSAEEGGGWFVDRTHIDAMYPALIQSVCRATPSARGLALAQIGALAARTGDPRALFVSDGAMTSRVERALHIAHVRAALEAAVAGAEKDCPFWALPVAGFDGRQTDRNRWTLSLESGGLLQLRRTNGAFTYGGAGTARILPGYGFGRVSILAGFEFAGGAMLKPGDGASTFVVNYFPSIPIVVRFHDVTWHYDFEVAGVSLFQADDAHVSYGVRFGFGLGLHVLRTRSFLPWAGAAIAYEHYFESGGRPVADFVRAGFRVGFQWDPQ